MRKYATSTYRIKLEIKRRARRRKKNATAGIAFVAAAVIAAFLVGRLNVPRAAEAHETTQTPLENTAALPPAVAKTAPETATSTPSTPKTLPEAPSASEETPSKAQKDATARVCRRIGQNRAAMLAEHNVSPELFATTCYYDTLAMAMRETGFICTKIGDQGRSRGCFQIQTKLHNVSVADAENYEWAAEWTIDRMVRDTDYPHLRTASIIRHNGTGPKAEAYAADVKRIAEQYRAAGL